MRHIPVYPHNLTDNEVILRILSGEKELYEVIIRRYNQRLFRISRTYVHDDQEAEDVVQQAYINAYEHLPQFERRSRFSTWLIRITINEALRRTRSRGTPVSIDAEPGDDTTGPLEVPADARDNPAEKVMNDELKSILERTIDALPVKYRSVFVMREVEGLSVQETGTLLGITPANVKVRLNRAKEMLRQSIDGTYELGKIYHFDLVRCDRIVANVLARVQRYGPRVYSPSGDAS